MAKKASKKTKSVYFTVIQVRHSKPLKTLKALKKLLSDQELPEGTGLWIIDSSKLEIDAPRNKETLP